MCDRIAVMGEGRILAVLEAGEASQERIMSIILQGHQREEAVHG